MLSAGTYFLTKKSFNPEINTSLSVSKAMSGGDTAGYRKALHPREFVFPPDFGPHPDYKTEWWYFTGNLQSASRRHFGFQLTIFRTAISHSESSDSAAPSEKVSPWRSSQVYMGHFTITDADNKKFYFFERFSRGSEKLAGAAAKPFRVWLEDWEITEIPGKESYGIPAFHLKAEDNGVLIDLTLKSLKPVVLQGNKGLSLKGPEKGNASYYYSLTRLLTNGVIKTSNGDFSLTGFSWMDREWSTSALGRNQAGWDWFSLQMNNSKEIMYYQMRQKNGMADSFSQGLIVNEDGSSEPIKKEDVKLEVLDYWNSPVSGKYPSGWRLSVPGKDINLEIIPYLSNQELNVSVRYWEGAVKIKGTWNNRPVEGNGYVELTGYGEVL